MPEASTAGRTAVMQVSRRATLVLIGIIVVVIAGLTALDLFLENLQQTELQDEAQQFYRTGARFLQQGQANQAIDPLRRAHALVRENAGYELALIEALIAAGKISEAEPLLNEVLLHEPNDGRANLIAARLMAKKDKLADADSYYHRAIYGEWSEAPLAHRISARMELIDFLVAKQRKNELLAELLPLEEEAGNNPAIQKRLGQLFLLADSAARAEEVYQSLIHEDPKDAQAYAGLGEAELQLGEFHKARAAFLAASARDPGNAQLRQRAQLASTMSSLDPTPRQLPSIEKYRRSLRILELARAGLEQCIAKQPSLSSRGGGVLLADADKALSNKLPPHVTNELAEEVLGLTERIWQMETNACGVSSSPESEPLRLIMEKLAR